MSKRSDSKPARFSAIERARLRIDTERDEGTRLSAVLSLANEVLVKLPGVLNMDETSLDDAADALEHAARVLRIEATPGLPPMPPGWSVSKARIGGQEVAVPTPPTSPWSPVPPWMPPGPPPVPGSDLPPHPGVEPQGR